MQLKEIHNFVRDLVKLLSEKSRPEGNKEYTAGQLYEARYILEVMDKIIYENKQYNF